VHNPKSGSLVTGLSRTLSACAVAITTFIGCADAPPAEEAVGESRSAVEVPLEECLPGTYPDASQGAASVCSPCSPIPFCTSVVRCTDANDSICSACARGYQLDDRYQCRACQPGTYASDDGCTPCPSRPGCGAVTCTNANDVACSECDSGYFRDTSVAPAACKPCTPVSGCVSSLTCTTATNSACTQCAEGSWLSLSVPSICTSCSPVPNCTTAISCTNASNSTCTPSCSGFGADPLLWGQPLARNGQAADTDPSAGGTLKYRYQRGSTILIKVRALDCSSADITSEPNVNGTVHVYADLSCDGVADQELQIDRDGRTSSPGTMKKADGFLAYDLDTSKFPSSRTCFVLEVMVRDTTTGKEAREKTLLQRK
jgi:hypothetical protein